MSRTRRIISIVSMIDGRPIEFAFIPVRLIMCHEDVVETRVKEIAAHIREHQVLCDPIIVIRMPSGEYVAADGHHRLAGLDSDDRDIALCHVINFGDISPRCRCP